MSIRIPLQFSTALKALLFLLFPVLFLCFALPFNRTQYGNDPEYAYLMNGINIGMLKPVGHTDNPGTTVQLYSAVMLRSAYLFQPDKSEGFQKHILRNSDKYIEFERKGLIWFNAIVIFILGFVSWLMLRSTWFSLLLQIMPFTSVNLTEHVFTKVSPEPVLLIAVAAFILVIFSFHFRKNADEAKYSVWFAIATAFGLATKATFLPMVIIPLVLLNSRVLWKRYLLFIIPFFLLFTFPAIPQYPSMAKWFLGLTAHTGTYGEGGLGVINPLKYINDLLGILVNNPVLSITVLTSVILLTLKALKSEFRNEFKKNAAFRIITAVTLALLVGILMVAKHYHANHYLIPELCMMAVLWIFIFLYLKDKTKSVHKNIFNALAGLAVFITLCLVIMNRKALQTADEGYIKSNADYEKMMHLIQTEYRDYTLAYYYPTSINQFSGLRWGNVYSKFSHLNALKQLFPQCYFFDIRNTGFSLWETSVNSHTLAAISRNKILIVGGPFEDADKDKMLQSGLRLTLVYRGYSQILYSVEVVAKTSI